MHIRRARYQFRLFLEIFAFFLSLIIIFIAFFYELKILPKLHSSFSCIFINRIFFISKHFHGTNFFTNSHLFPTFQNLFIQRWNIKKKSYIFSNWSSIIYWNEFQSWSKFFIFEFSKKTCSIAKTRFTEFIFAEAKIY